MIATPRNKKAAKPKASAKAAGVPPGGFEGVLEAARQLVIGDASGLPRLLEVWRACPAPTLGELIVRFAPDEHQLATLWECEPDERIARVDVLGQVEPDPRIASALVDLVETPPSASRRLWGPLLEQLGRHHRDPRVLPRLREVDTRALLGPTEASHWISSRLREAIVALERFEARSNLALPDEPELLALLATPRTSTPRTSTPEVVEQALVERCVAELDADAPRLVYADWLDSVGRSAQAEFVRMQLARAHTGEPASEREQQLATRGARWLAPILPMLEPHGWQFERGLLESCVLALRKGEPRSLAGHWLWASVRGVTLTGLGDLSAILVHPVMSNLRDVWAWRHESLAGLLDSDAPIERLHRVLLARLMPDHCTRAALVACERLPRLELVHCLGGEVEHLHELCSGGLRRPGLRLVVTHHQLDARWITALIEHANGLPQLTLTNACAEFEFDVMRRTLRATMHRGEGTWAVTEALGCHSLSGNHRARVERGTIATLELRVPVGGVELDPLLERAGRSLGCDVLVREGVWPTRYLDRFSPRLSSRE